MNPGPSRLPDAAPAWRDRADAWPRRPALARLSALLAAAYAGVLVAIAALVAPAAFALLSRPDAGALMGRVFERESQAGLVLGVLLILLQRGRARRPAAMSAVVDPATASVSGSGSDAAPGAGAAAAPVLTLPVLLLLGTVFCTVLGGYGIQPMMAAARAGQAPLSFGALHAISTALYGLKLLLWCGLAWRLAR